jgi:hypothetical protein
MTIWGSWTRPCSCTLTMAMAAMPPHSSMNNGVSAPEPYKKAGQSNLVQSIPVYTSVSSSSESNASYCQCIKCQLKLLGVLCVDKIGY